MSRRWTGRARASGWSAGEGGILAGGLFLALGTGTVPDLPSFSLSSAGRTVEGTTDSGHSNPAWKKKEEPLQSLKHVWQKKQ